jgi:hypothetical protein
MRRFTSLYGAGPRHAVLMLGGFALAGYVASRILGASHPGWIVVWLIGAIVVHDFILFPLYAGLDRATTRRLPTVGRNYVRVPAVIAGMLLLVTFPLVLGLSETGYSRATGLHTSVYLGRWLAVTACLFAGSALVYGTQRIVRLASARSSARRTDSAVDTGVHSEGLSAEGPHPEDHGGADDGSQGGHHERHDERHQHHEGLDGATDEDPT